MYMHCWNGTTDCGDGFFVNYVFKSILKLWQLISMIPEGTLKKRCYDCWKVCEVIVDIFSFFIVCGFLILWIKIQCNPSWEATPFAPEKWPFKRGGLSSEVKINIFMFRFTVSSDLSRGVGLSSGWPLKRGSTVLACSRLMALARHTRPASSYLFTR